MADMMVIRSYAGLRPWTEDHLPIISRVEHIPITLLQQGMKGMALVLPQLQGK